MSEVESLRTKLDDIDSKIKAMRERLQLKNLFDKDRGATLDDLSKRYALLAGELDEEVADLEAHGRHVGDLEKALLRFVNSVGFDH